MSETLAERAERTILAMEKAGYPAVAGTMRELAAAIARLARERDDLQASFDLRWNADQRAIAAWQTAHPGNDLVWPGHSDLCVWLMTERDAAHAARAAAVTAAATEAPTPIVTRLRETLTGEDTDEAMWRRIVRERQEAADAIVALRVKLHRERSKVGMMMAERKGQR